MEKFYLEASKSSPEVEYIEDEDVLKIKGESYPENSFAFYKPIFEFIEKVINKKGKLTLQAEIVYLNTSSTKSFMNMLDQLEEAYQNGNDISVKWYYEEDNEHSYELALDFKDYLELPFDITTTY